jgi:O-methyltransferase
MIQKLLKNMLARSGYKIVRAEMPVYGQPVPHELEPEFLSLYEKCRPFTMTTLERMYAAYKAAIYVAQMQIPGAVVECGVWKGGSSMMMALALLQKGDTGRDIYLFDTYEGMPEPGKKDQDLTGTSAYGTWKENQTSEVNKWCYSPLEEVQQNLISTGYPKNKVHFVKGKVEDTIPATIPNQISLLRLDTDWYDSTYHELIHLFPRLAEKGVLIIDDYGHWQGAREATDQYFAENNVSMLLNRIDYTGRIGIKI